MGNRQGVPGDAIPTYNAQAAVGIVPKTGGGMVPGLVARAGPGLSYGAFAALVSGMPTGWIVGYNATVIPPDGVIDPAKVIEAMPIAAGTSYASISSPTPVSYTVGVVYYLTKGADPYAAKDTSSNYKGFISAKVLAPGFGN